VEDSLKKEAEKIFSELGLSMSTATNVYYKQVVRHGGIPFVLRLSDPFYSASNQDRLNNSILNYETGKSKPTIKSMHELENLSSG